MIDLRKLRGFVTVAQERHFGRAAERLHMAQPALSQQVKALERELGVQLLTRSTRRVELTAAGAQLLESGLELLTSAEAVTAQVRRIDAGVEGHLRLGFIGSATYELMPALARALQAEVPLLHLDLKGEMLGPEVADALAEGRLDVGVLRPFAPRPGVVARVLRSEALVAAVPADHPAAEASEVALADLREERFVGYPAAASTVADAVAEACRAAGFTPDVRAQVRETAALVSFVAAGLGVALVPQGVRNVRIPGVAYVPLAGAAPTVDLVVAWREEAPEGAVRQVLSRLLALAEVS